MRQRYVELDAIRGVAILMVALYHYTVRYGQLYSYSVLPLFNFKIGQYGVHLFFIVSGFVIFLTLDKTTHAVDFIVSRFSRLFPAYWIAIFLTFSIVYFFKLPSREVDIKTALINLTMLQKWFEISNVDGVYWTLSIELSFYFIMFFLFILKQLRYIEIYSLLWLSIIIFCHYIKLYYFIELPSIVQFTFIFDYANLFIAGIMFYKIAHQEKLLHYLVIALALLTEYILYNKLALLIILYFVLFLMFSKNKFSYIASAPLIFLGNISYSLYLIHQNIGFIIIRNLEIYNLSTPITVFAIPLIVSISIAAFMYHYVEKPALSIIRTKWKATHLREFLIN